MKRVHSQVLPTPGHGVPLDDVEARHVVQVLRLRNGDKVEALDGQGTAQTVLIQNKGGKWWIEHAGGDSGVRKAEKGETVPVTIALSVLKGDAMEWAIEKCVELGVQSLIPLVTERTVVRLGAKDPEAFRSRWTKVAIQSLKQCGRLHSLNISLPLTLEDYLASLGGDSSPMVYCDETHHRDSQLTTLTRLLGSKSEIPAIRILIGPEGGWSDSERSLLGREGTGVSLGPLILRAETAVAFCASLTASHFREILTT